MLRTKQADLQVEQLEDRLVPSTTSGILASGVSWSFDSGTNRLTITGTSSADYIRVQGNSSTGTLQIVNPVWNGYWTNWAVYDTGVALSPTLKVAINGLDGNDNLANALQAGQYQSAVIHGGNGDDVINSYSFGGGKD